MSQCTWADGDKACTEEAKHPQVGKGSHVWANLCERHHKMLEEVMGVDAKRMLSYWIRAQGGSKTAAKRMGGV